MECSIRLVRGDCSRVRRRWSGGVADIAAGRFEFLTYMPPGVRIRHPFRKRLTLHVLAVATAGRRPRASAWGLGRNTVIVSLEIAGGTVEAAVPESSCAWFVATLAPAP